MSNEIELKSAIEDMETLLIYACRYAHDRKTGAAYQIVNIAKRNWHELSSETRQKLAKEAQQATCNYDDWDRLLSD